MSSRFEQVKPAEVVMLLISVTVTFVPSQSSTAAGGVNGGFEPVHSTTTLLAQVSTGGVVSTTRMICVQVLALLQVSIACQTRVIRKRFEQVRPAVVVILLKSVIVTF